MSNTELPAVNREPNREQLFATLMAHVRDDGNAAFLAQMLASWLTGKGVLPATMGLTPEAFAAMNSLFFPGFTLSKRMDVSDDWFAKMPETEELQALFADYAVDAQPQRQWIGSMLIAGCIGQHHLWEDLGLFSRQDLTAMMALNFPPLATMNARDMKWKKFIYKQLCEKEGIIACPVPTCEACADYASCFGPEDRPSC